MSLLFHALQGQWFGHPVSLERPLGVVLAAALLALTFVAVRSQRRAPVVKGWVTPGREGELISARWRQRRSLRLALGGLGLALLALAWAGPTLGQREEQVTHRGIDLVVALDASRSMLAGDVAPDRLTAARAAAEQLLGRLGGDRVGVVAFARDAFVQAPLTTDRGAARLYLRAVDPTQMQQGGTALAGALKEAGGLFERAEVGGRDRAVLLISDGEDWEGGAEEEARALAATGIHVYTLGVGTLAGAPVPIVDARGRLTGYQKDAQGSPVVTRPNPEALAAIARAGNGEAFFADGAVDVAPIAQRLEGLQKGELGSSARIAGIERYQWFVLPGVLLLALALGLGEEQKKRGAARPAQAAVVALALLAPRAHAAGWLQSAEPAVKAGLRAYEQGDYPGAAKSFAQARVDTATKPVAEFDRGVALLKAGQRDAALQAFEQARSPSLQGREAYNAGLAQAQLQKRDEAISSFRAALVADASNEDARHNLEVLLEQQQKDQQQKDQQQKDQQQKDQQQKDQQQKDQQQKDQQQKDQQQKDQQQKDQQQKDQQQKDQQQKDQQQKDQQQKDQQQKEGQQTPPPVPRTPEQEARSEAERKLDQLQRGERLLPLGRPRPPPPEENRDEHTW